MTHPFPNQQPRLLTTPHLTGQSHCTSLKATIPRKTNFDIILHHYSNPLTKGKNANTLFALLRVPQRTPRAMQIFPHLSMLDEYPSAIPIAKKRHLSTPITHTMQNYNIGKRVCGVSFYTPVYPLRRRTVATYPSS
jgi:hypothetical protein